jgi:hypothetical protein
MELPVKYLPEHYEKKAQRYATTLKWLFGVRVDEATRVRWASVISLSRGIDTYLDEAPRGSLLERTEDIKGLLNSDEEIAEMYPALARGRLGADTHGTFFDTGMSILDLNLLIKSTTSIERYALLRRQEGEEYGHLIADLATPEVASQPGYASFATGLPRVGGVTNLLNSFRQIHDDYRRGELELVPDVTARPILLGHVCLDLIQPQAAREVSFQ